MVALMFATWVYLALHAGIGTAMAEPCTTDTECGCALDCLDGPAYEEDGSP